jgi:hypothetical protein
LAWSDSMGFLNSQNTSIMQDLSESLNDQDDLVKFGVPLGTILNQIAWARAVILRLGCTLYTSAT